MHFSNISLLLTMSKLNSGSMLFLYGFYAMQ